MEFIDDGISMGSLSRAPTLCTRRMTLVRTDLRRGCFCVERVSAFTTFVAVVALAAAAVLASLGVSVIVGCSS